MATKSVFRLLYTESREATLAKREYEINRDQTDEKMEEVR